ncbi:hypothetical protein [Bacillus sp. FJAT-44742]|uniref:hypothetical protein n=1 Tax=Bacillus sp. FJAT-44742 TaxID=2014005 RepID=UPI000C23E864|nr:hypothetical protein [Bacillus sp. FJAT-44742]
MTTSTSTKPLTNSMILRFFIAKELYYTHRSSSELWQYTKHVLKHHPPAKRSFQLVMSKMQQEGFVKESFKEKRTTYYSLTDEGREYYQGIKLAYRDRLMAAKQVAAVFLYEITKEGERPKKGTTMIEKDRPFFSSLVSVKDVFRYIVLTRTYSGRTIVIAEPETEMLEIYGWKVSTSYAYEVAIEMEEDPEIGGLVTGKWEGERRRKRLLKITPLGRQFYERIKQDTADRVRNAYHYLDTVIKEMDDSN